MRSTYAARSPFCAASMRSRSTVLASLVAPWWALLTLLVELSTASFILRGHAGARFRGVSSVDHGGAEGGCIVDLYPWVVFVHVAAAFLSCWATARRRGRRPVRAQRDPGGFRLPC